MPDMQRKYTPDDQNAKLAISSAEPLSVEKAGRHGEARPECSYERILHPDLKRLGEIARADARNFFSRNPRYGALENRGIAVALCQGAGLHFVTGTNGIKDFDVWTFYAELPGLRYPARRPPMAYDFSDPKFGRSPDFPSFIGRKVDCLARSLKADLTADPILALRTYLLSSSTGTPGQLSRKGVVLIEPGRLLGTVIWPM
jgi:hypothetical protein